MITLIEQKYSVDLVVTRSKVKLTVAWHTKKLPLNTCRLISSSALKLHRVIALNKAEKLLFLRSVGERSRSLARNARTVSTG